MSRGIGRGNLKLGITPYPLLHFFCNFFLKIHQLKMTVSSIQMELKKEQIPMYNETILSNFPSTCNATNLKQKEKIYKENV